MVVAPFKAEAIAIAMSPAFQTPCHLTQRGLVALTHSVDTEEARVRVPFAASHMEMEEVPRRKEPNFTVTAPEFLWHASTSRSCEVLKAMQDSTKGFCLTTCRSTLTFFRQRRVDLKLRQHVLYITFAL